MAMSHQLGFFIGPPIGGLIIDLVHWRGIFFVLFIPSLVGLALCFVTGRPVSSSTSRRQPVDYPGAAIFLGLTVLATMVLDQKIAEVLGGSSQALLAVAFVGVLGWFVAHEKKTPSPMIDLSFFRSRFSATVRLACSCAVLLKGWLRSSSLFISRACRSLADFYRRYLSRAVALQHGAIARERHLDRSYRRPLALDYWSCPPDGSLSNRR